MNWTDIAQIIEQETGLKVDRAPEAYGTLWGGEFYSFWVYAPENPDKQVLFSCMANYLSVLKVCTNIRETFNRNLSK